MSDFAKSLSWLLPASAVTLALVLVSGRSSPTIAVDTPTYQDFDFAEPLSQIRTVGYPTFLRIVGSVDQVPLAQWACLCGAVILFCRGMIAAGYRWQVATLCASTLLFGRSVFEWGSVVTPDSLAISSAIASTGSFLALSRQRTHVFWWASLTVLTFCTYQIRPAYLFMVPLWPVTGLIADWLLLRRGDSIKQRLGWAGALALATLIPLVAFCSLRCATVGHFGLVSFGGYNVVGITSQFLDNDLAEELPEHLRPFAHSILRRRASIPDYVESTDFYVMEEMFNLAIWEIAVPEAEAICQNETQRVDALLSELSWEIIRRRPMAYGKWLVRNANHARQQIITVTVFDRGTVLLMAIVGFVVLVSLWNGPIGYEEGGDSTERHHEFHLLPWVAFGFVLAKTMLVVLIEFANSRYMSGAACLLPAALGVWATHFAEHRLALCSQFLKDAES